MMKSLSRFLAWWWIAPWIFGPSTSPRLHELKKKGSFSGDQPKGSFWTISELVNQISYCHRRTHPNNLSYGVTLDIARGACSPSKPIWPWQHRVCLSFGRRNSPKPRVTGTLQQRAVSVTRALLHWKNYLFNSPYPVICYTDHRNITPS